METPTNSRNLIPKSGCFRDSWRKYNAGRVGEGRNEKSIIRSNASLTLHYSGSHKRGPGGMSQPSCHYRGASSPLKSTLINSLKDINMPELPWVLGFHPIWKLFYWVCGIWHYSNGCDHRLKDKVLIHHLALMLYTLGPAIFFSRLFFFLKYDLIQESTQIIKHRVP